MSTTTDADASRPASISKKLKLLRLRVRTLIEPEYGLLEALLSADVLTDEQVEYICKGNATVFEKNDRLLGCLIRKESLDVDERIIQCLIQTDQEHVANFLRCGGG